jgi:hypothetical protein
MIIQLSGHEVITTASIGARRRASAVARGLKQYGNGDLETYDVDILAAMSEFAVARALNLFWDAHVGDPNGGDVGLGLVEVRMRRMPGNGGDLAIKPKDLDDKPYVLVHGYRDGRMDLRGWLYGRAAKDRKGQWCEPKQVWFVPPPYEPMESLIEMFKRGAA